MADIFPDSIHVRNVGLRDSDDAIIWDYAARYGLAIVTKDADFRQRSFLLGHPHKIVWLRLGNCTTKAIAELLRGRASDIEELLLDQERSFFSLS